MIFCILSKIIATLGAVVVTQNYELNPLLTAFLIGVTPIWLEVAAKTVMKVEPAREKRKNWLVANAFADIVSFLIIPIWWWAKLAGDSSRYALTFFLACGLFRISNFLTSGPKKSYRFDGLPTAYTGYLWTPLVLISTVDFLYTPNVLIVIVSILMIIRTR